MSLEQRITPDQWAKITAELAIAIDSATVIANWTVEKPEGNGVDFLADITALRGHALRLEQKCFVLMTMIHNAWHRNYTPPSPVVKPKAPPTTDDLLI